MSLERSARHLFEVPEDGIYLRGHAVGCLPRGAREATERFFDQWAARGAGSWDAWLSTISTFLHALAQVLGVRAAELSSQVNLSSALTKLIGSLPRRRGRRRIVYSELDFPSLGFVCQKAAALGYEPSCLRAEDDALPLSVWDRHLTRDVALAHITHVASDDGRQVDLPAVLSMCRERDIFTVVDVAQSAGVVPIDLTAWGATCAIGCSVKWLCGGPGASFLWVRGDVLPDLQPIDVGWFSHAQPFDLDIRHFEYAPDALRFWGGTPSVLPFAVATAGLEVIGALGTDRIRAHNLALTRRLRDDALAAGLSVRTPLDEAQHGGTIAISFPDDEGAVRWLGAHGVQVDRRRCGVRFSPHIYNTMEEIDAVCALLVDARSKVEVSAAGGTR
jgi:kynureninase